MNSTPRRIAQTLCLPKGTLALVLHAHLPFVRHPEHPSFLEEEWLFEAITECYLPLISILDRLVSETVPCRLTLSISPTLTEMLNDSILRSRYLHYLTQRMELAEKEVLRTKHDSTFHPLALMYRSHYFEAYEQFEVRCKQNLLSAFSELQNAGALEIITSPATHAFLPFVSNEESRRAQLVLASLTCQKYFGKRPRGLWLAECGYEPGLEALFKEAGFDYFILDAHGILFGTPRPTYGVFAPVRTPGGTMAFGRDMESSRQVWSSKVGYPGDYDYREFYRDLGYDGDYDYIRSYLHADGVRRNLGFKYFRITGESDLGQRAPYNPDRALARAHEHAGNFVFNRALQIDSLYQTLNRHATVVSPYDAELFGHWWFEGPQFLDQVIRMSALDQKTFRLATLSEVLEEDTEPLSQQPAGSSWGAHGYHQVWLNERNQWLYRHQHWAEASMVELADRFPAAEGTPARMLNQAARELLLAESSDWAFLINQGTSATYAVRRFRDHIHRFKTLHDEILRRSRCSEELDRIEAHDNIFPDLDYRLYGKHGAVGRKQ